MITQFAPLPLQDGWPGDSVSARDALVAPSDFTPQGLHMHSLVAVELTRLGLAEPVGLTSRLTAHDPSELLITREVELEFATCIFGIEKDVPNHIQVFVRNTQQVATFPAIAREFGMSAIIYVNTMDEIPWNRLAPSISDECEHFLEQLVMQVERGTVESTRRDLIFQTLLSYAARQTMLITERSGIVVRTSKSVAARVLNLPIIPAYGVLVSPMRIIRDFISVHRLGKAWTPPWKTAESNPVFDILLGICQPRRVLSLPSRSASSLESNHSSLFEWLKQTIERLSPFRESFRITPSQITGGTSFLKHAYYEEGHIYEVQVAIAHPFIQSVLKGEVDRNLLLLTVFASLNTVYQEITNDHEMTLQSRVIDEISTF